MQSGQTQSLCTADGRETSVRKVVSRSNFTEQIFTLYRQNKFSNVCANYFHFASGGTIHVTHANVQHCWHSFFLRLWQDIMLNCDSACADAIQTT